MKQVKRSVETVTNAASDEAKQLKERLTVLWNDLEHWQQDNHYIRSGYRPASNSVRKSARSLAYIHNETVNIYSHLLGSIAAIVGSAFLYRELAARYETASREDVFVFGCFFLGAAMCLTLSAWFHTVANHSPNVHQFSNKLDYLGIVFLIWGSFIPSIYYGFREHPRLIKTYWVMITTISACCAEVVMSPKFASSKYRPLRATMFIAMGLSGVIPVLHGTRLYELSRIDELISLRWMATQGALYIIGAIIYACRVPERLKPGHFDIWGSSHQIFHFFVLIAACCHLVGVIKAFDSLHRTGQHPKLDFLGWSIS
ncbi:HlyIII-domain-containing protein [Eremomyces bilateralis CBS 781.70]|uniref:HlyIII-domain-containing protein n=1 Tax=Eremomyces bilateralis CBS 781.70 TaxID=1392243 RepID=A0A6G1G4F2_9PEZI|nr:HlyIII-domain-containing protein [Eremomyces bilateralis CBS 781.70]KAF1812790.1 HlyIII-domain-containing protein [Eremomyces bilateralis CBS 781.70]